MAFVTVSGQPGCREVELARVAAERLEWELVTEPDLAKRLRPSLVARSGFQTWPGDR